MGPKYRKSWNGGFKEAREDIVNSVDDCVAVWSQKKVVASAVLQQ